MTREPTEARDDERLAEHIARLERRAHEGHWNSDDLIRSIARLEIQVEDSERRKAAVSPPRCAFVFPNKDVCDMDEWHPFHVDYPGDDPFMQEDKHAFVRAAAAPPVAKCECGHEEGDHAVSNGAPAGWCLATATCLCNEFRHQSDAR